MLIINFANENEVFKNVVDGDNAPENILENRRTWKNMVGKLYFKKFGKFRIRIVRVLEKVLKMKL